MTDPVPSNTNCAWSDGCCPTPNSCRVAGRCEAKVRGLVEDPVPSKPCSVCECPDGDHYDWCTPQAREQRPSNEWGIAEAFKTLKQLTEGSSAAVGAMGFLRVELTRLSRPAHEREPPHCSNCSCGMTAPEPAAEWQPIETAPKDGTSLLLYSPGGICIAPWPPAELTAQQNAQLVKDLGECPDHRKWTVTHWMPLPARPSQPPGAGQ